MDKIGFSKVRKIGVGGKRRKGKMSKKKQERKASKRENAQKENVERRISKRKTSKRKKTKKEKVERCIIFDLHHVCQNSTRIYRISYNSSNVNISLLNKVLDHPLENNQQIYKLFICDLIP
jgi:sRNA-binding protein